MPASPRRWLAVAILALLSLLAAAVWLLWPRENKLASVSELQRQILATGGAPSRGDIARVMQTIDRMDRREVWAAYRAAGEEWNVVKQAAIDAYFAAPPAERPAMLDQQIERLVAYHDLLVAMNPGARPGSPAPLPRERRRRRQPEPNPVPEKTAAEREAEQFRRELAKRFDEAVEARALARRIGLPAFR